MTKIQEDYQSLIEILKKRNLIDQSIDILTWDQYVMSTELESEDRANQISCLMGISHELFTSPKTGELLEKLTNGSTELITDHRKVVKLTRKEYLENTRVPTELVEKFSNECRKSESSWLKARKEDDFDIFLPNFKKVIELSREVALKKYPGKDPYESMLLDFEPDLDLKTVTNLIKNVELNVYEILKLWNSNSNVDKRTPEFLSRKVPVEKQREYCNSIAEILGFDFSKNRVDEGAHPCTIAKRVLTRYNDGWFDAILTIMHEVGHHKYDLNASENFLNNPLDRYLSFSVHESQSRLLENHVGKSNNFWKANFDNLKKSYSPVIDDIELEFFINEINKPKSSLIRVVADEVTYPLHIALRFEIEKDLISGKLKPENLPDMWNEKIKYYLGLDVPNNTLGCLQEDHWAEGCFGYFPTYVLGNIMAAQFYNAAKEQIPSLEDEISNKNMKPLLNWLKENVHKHGRRYDTQTLVKKATGREVNASDYVEHLSSKVKLAN